MSKIIYACPRHVANQELTHLERRIASGASRLTPNDANVRPLRIVSDGRIVFAILNPSATVLAEPGSVCLGHVATDSRWNEFAAARPEGTYSICRSNGRAIELLSDAVGSRTLWYYIDDSVFVASTSQRWIATILGNFEPNAKALPWMLTTGTLGPTDGWDERLARLQADSTLVVDLENWTSQLTTRDAKFSSGRSRRSNQQDDFRASLLRGFEQSEFDYSKWVLPLSGGYDSRAMLCMLRNKEKLRTITWGTKDSVLDSGSDAAIAAILAKSVGVANEYFTTDSSKGSLAEVLEKFVAYGEGRVDHLSGYLDGFSIWKTLLNRGIEGIIRGDEAFGWKRVTSFIEARRSVGLLLWSDFSNLPDQESLGIDSQEIPAFLNRRHHETPAQWRDRLYHQFRVPTILAALTDLKSSFVEVSNPLLTHSIINAVRSIHDDLRTDKKLFKRVVAEFSPKIPYAVTTSIADRNQVLRSNEAVELISAALKSDTARELFSEPLLDYIFERIRRESLVESKPIQPGLRRWISRVIPSPIKHAVRKPIPTPIMDFNQMAFRVCIICKTHELFRSDAAADPGTKLS